jgi:threonine dehydrogenase-like Zn-dependent dehydrogenase
VVRDGLERPLAEALELEARAFSRLVVSDQARRLMGVFFMKNEVEARAAALAEKARPLGTVGILGAGFMGSGIAQVLAYRGVEVVLKDRDQPSLERGLAFCREQLDELEEKGKLSRGEAEAARSRVRGTVTYDELRGVDFVIEGVFEVLGV